jgi:hypothetical protein
MPTKLLLRFAAIAIFAGLWVLVLPQPSTAQAVASCQQVLQYEDVDGDGLVEAMALACQFTPSTNDTLTIYKQSGHFLSDMPWVQNITYQAEIWIFDHGSRGKASLIIHFRRDGTALVAEIYDDRDQDGEVRYEIDGGQVIITESQYWTVQVVVPDGWWVREESLNYNLRLEIDGDIEGMFLMEAYRGWLETDGVLDYDLQIYDQNHNGKPEFDKRMILTPFLQDSAGLQTQMMANWADDELPISGGFSLWPYLDLAHEPGSGSSVVKNYPSTPPPIKFAPSTGRIDAIGEFVASRGGEHNCFYYSAVDWVAGELNESDFESPFCFYDLAQDGDRVPELQVRAAYWFPNDWHFLDGEVDGPYEMIRYSWDQENSQTWRYAVGLVGRHLMDEIVTMAGLDVLTIPYEEFPSWVMERTWDMAVFSEFTGRSYFTSEGNYSVSYPGNDEFAEYFTGRSDQQPAAEYAPEVNFKMEWAMDTMSQPYLYFSPVDHRLHLRGATGGIWNLGAGNTIRYANLDGDAYLDQWQELQGGDVLQELNYARGLFVYAGQSLVTIKQADPRLSLFETLPPTNYTEWQDLGQKLSAVSPTFSPSDFMTMIAQFAGEETQITGATLRNYRITSDGFRFILTLQPGFTISGPDWLGLQGRPAGEYAATYDGSYHLEILAPPALVLRFKEQSPDLGESLTANISGEIMVKIDNQGLEDAQQVLVMLGTSQAGGKITWSAPQMVRVLAGETTTASFQWAPPASGEWKLEVWANLLEPGPAGGTVASSEQVILVQAAQGTNLRQEMSAFGVVAPWQVVLLLAAFLGTAGLTGWVLTRALGKEVGSQPTDPGQGDARSK